MIVKNKAADFVAPVYLPGDYLFTGTDVDAYLSRAPVPAAVEGDVQFSAYRKDYLRVSFDYTAQTDAVVELPLYAYPAYRATLGSGEELRCPKVTNHILTVMLPAGRGHVEVSYSQPWYFTLADLLSLLSILALAARGVLARRSRRRSTPVSS